MVEEEVGVIMTSEKILTEDLLNDRDIFSEERANKIRKNIKKEVRFTEYESNSELPIDECVEYYKKYVSWKEEQFKAKRGNNGYK